MTHRKNRHKACSFADMVASCTFISTLLIQEANGGTMNIRYMWSESSGGSFKFYIASASDDALIRGTYVSAETLYSFSASGNDARCPSAEGVLEDRYPSYARLVNALLDQIAREGGHAVVMRRIEEIRRRGSAVDVDEIIVQHELAIENGYLNDNPKAILSGQEGRKFGFFQDRLPLVFELQMKRIWVNRSKEVMHIVLIDAPAGEPPGFPVGTALQISQLAGRSGTAAERSMRDFLLSLPVSTSTAK